MRTGGKEPDVYLVLWWWASYWNWHGTETGASAMGVRGAPGHARGPLLTVQLSVRIARSCGTMIKPTLASGIILRQGKQNQLDPPVYAYGPTLGHTGVRPCFGRVDRPAIGSSEVRPTSQTGSETRQSDPAFGIMMKSSARR